MASSVCKQEGERAIALEALLPCHGFLNTADAPPFCAPLEIHRPPDSDLHQTYSDEPLNDFIQTRSRTILP